MHYTKTLSRKPGALRGSLAFKQMNSSLKEIYNKFFKDQPKAFIELLELIGTHDIVTVNNIINILTQKSIPVNTENIKIILNRDNTLIDNNTKKSHMQKEIEENSKRHLCMYDAIIGTADLKGGVAV